MDTQAQEIERLKREVEQLKQQLDEKQQLATPTSPSLRDNLEFVTEMARFSEGIASESAVRKKFHFDEATWERLASDEQLIERIELEKVRRVRDGSFKREKAQQLIVKGPEILDGIMSDNKANAKHRIDAAKTLDQFAGFTSENAAEQDRVVVSITLTADEKITFNRPLRPTPTDGEIIDVTPPLPGFAI